MSESKKMDFLLERAVLTLPEVAIAFSKAGSANLVFDAMPPNTSDNYVILKPKNQWPAGVRTKDEIIERIHRVTAPIVGNAYETTQPMQMRFNELISGVKSDVAVSVFGDDLDRMGATAREVVAVLARVPGVSEPRIGQTEGVPSFDIKIDRDMVSRYGLTMEDVADTVSTALGGRPAGLLFNGDRRYPIIVRLPNAQRNDLDALGALPVMLHAARSSGPAPVGSIAPAG